MNIPDRIDYTTPGNYLPIYTIDPEGCEDADDAFSLVEHGSGTTLYIHIADPTDEFSPNDELFSQIVAQGTTKYSLHDAPRHLFPRPTVIKQSLMEPDPECPFHELAKRPAISIVYNIGTAPEQRVLGTPRIQFTYIKCDPKLRQTYEKAAEDKDQVPILKKCMEIGNAMWRRRVPVGRSLAKLVKARPIKDKGTGAWKFQVDPEPVRDMKRMIGEFAIASNTCVAEYLKTHNIQFVRHCQSLPDGTVPGTADEIMLEIIKRGIRAQQDTVNLRHLLVGDSLQTHFTSPLRRASDCIVHFLLKSTHLGIDPPFEPETMADWALHLNGCFSDDKKRQFGEIKRVSLQIIQNMLQSSGSVNLKWKQTGYTGLFLNAMIMEVNEFPVNISVTIRQKNLRINVDGTMNHTRITRINPAGAFDNLAIPELAEAMVR